MFAIWVTCLLVGVTSTRAMEGEVQNLMQDMSSLELTKFPIFQEIASQYPVPSRAWSASFHSDTMVFYIGDAPSRIIRSSGAPRKLMQMTLILMAIGEIVDYVKVVRVTLPYKL